tara:strand:- start:1034 stop:1735 length:702 start_codon:yes stop_codon:yes gene_type:complete
MNTIFKRLKNNKGNSLAEFAVTAAMMATLATTAAPRFAGVGETAKQNQTKANLDKIGKMANQFYMEKMAVVSANNPSGEGQGRLPGQEKYDEPLDEAAHYEYLYEVMDALDKDGESPFEKWNDAEGSKWKSVFGMENANLNLGYKFDEEQDNGGNTTIGHVEWRAFLSELEGPIKSPYRQGHYIYTVIEGGQKEYFNETTDQYETTTCNECGPILVVADAYNPSKFHIVKSFN